MSTITQADYVAMLSRLHGSTARQMVRDGVGQPTDEAALHNQILDECARRGWIAVHSRMDRATTTAKGVCDFLIIRDSGKVLLVECKSKTGKLTIEQQGFIAWCYKLQHTVHVVRSFQEFLEIIA